MATSREDQADRAEDEAKEAKRIIAQVDRESEAIGRSNLARSADAARNHMLAGDKDQADAVEVWGTRIARVLAVIAFAALAWWLYDFLQRPR